MNYLIDKDDKKVPDPESCPREEPKDLKLLELLIDKSIKRLEEDSCEPKIRDALKAIQLKQKVAKTSEAEKTFWQLIDDLRREELGPPANELAESTCSERSESKDKHEFCVLRSENLEAQILNTIVGLKDQVKNGILPVKTITDTFNQGKSKESRSQDPEFGLTYQRIGRLLSTMGFRKARTGSGASAIIWDEDFISRLCPSQNTESMIWDDSKEIKPSSETSERSETSETSKAKEAPSPLEKDRQDALPGQVKNPSPLGKAKKNRNLFLCPPSFWSHGH